jgi:hypothetical protein
MSVRGGVRRTDETAGGAMLIRLTDGPCKGEHDVSIADGANPPEEFLVLVEQGPRQKVDEIFGGSIPGVNVFAVHRLARHDRDGIPLYAFAGRRETRGY